jgi:Tol biopolymer transport system component
MSVLSPRPAAVRSTRPTGLCPAAASALNGLRNMRAIAQFFLKPGVVLLLVSPLAGFVSSAPTATSPTSASHALRGRIVFSRAGGVYGKETIFAANADGSHQRQLNKLGDGCCPRISRDGKRVLFSGLAPDGRITTTIMNFNGTHSRVIPLPGKTLNLGPGAWSPNGKRIAFQGWDNNNPSLNAIYTGRSSDAGNLKRVKGTNGNDLPGDYSPDGTRLAFGRGLPNGNSVGSVWVVNLNGSGLKELSPPKQLVGFGTIRWSPDGRNIMFQDARNEATGALWTVHPDGSHLKRVFQDSKGRFAISSTWSPDGKQIMFALDSFANEDDHLDNGLYVIKANGTGLTLVIGGHDFKYSPDWVR